MYLRPQFRKLLGFVVSERGIDINPDKVKVIMELPPPSTVCELTEYNIKYISRTSVRGQAIADYLAEFPVEDDTPINFNFPDEGILQVDEQWKTKDMKLIPYHEYLKKLTENFDKVSFTYTSRVKNQFTGALTTLASIVSITKENLIEPLEIMIAKGLAHCDVIEAAGGKPCYEDIKHFMQTNQYLGFADRHNQKTFRRIAAHHFLSNKTLYHCSFDAILLWCVDENVAQCLMEEVHEGSCGPYMNGLMLAKKLMRLGYFWFTMETDYVKHVGHYHLC
ncbi:hypothetical protein CRG98_018445 [Punica granatum]|uniref:Uncharacterized protein n=1 Tax=Punica granatum TaxID=22663 RepID=A0A2I0JXW2_PUNGR|nr:hypothetical protein CRG98_018445 [Punica granatum]